MRDQLIQYVNLLFAGAANCEDIRQEILQNTLDRYDDLIAEGKVPEAAYRLAIASIGDINEILGNSSHPRNPSPAPQPEEIDTTRKKIIRAIAVGLYILCPIPLLVLGSMGSDWMDIIGLCGLLAMVAAATVLMILGARKEEKESAEDLSPNAELRKSISSLIWTVGLIAYFGLSFFSGAWYITWLMFPMIGAVHGIAKAVFDLKATKTSATVRIVIWGIVALTLASLLLSAAGPVTISRTHSEPAATEVVVGPVQSLENEETLRLDPATVQELEINWVSGHILLEKADVDQITVSESDVADPTHCLSWHQHDKKVTIDFQENHRLIGIHTDDALRKDLYIYVPQDWNCQSLKVNAASAALEVNHLTIRELDLDGADGTCALGSCQIDDLDIDTASGDVTFSGTLNTLDFDAASASFTAIFANTPSRIDLDSMSGRLDISLPEDCGYTVNMDGLSSHFQSEFGTAPVHGDGRCQINVDGLNSDVTIRKSTVNNP